jgi:transposase
MVDVVERAAEILALEGLLKGIDRQIRETVRSHPQAVIESLPGMGPVLGAEFLVAAGDLTVYADVDHPASAAGPVPVPTGHRAGKLPRPKRYSRRLRRVFCISAPTSLREGPNRDFCLKMWAEEYEHVHAVIALARRRAGVLWALLRDNRVFTSALPVAQAA